MPEIPQHLLDHDFSFELEQFSRKDSKGNFPLFVESTINGIRYEVIRSTDLPWGTKLPKNQPQPFSYFIKGPIPVAKGGHGEIFEVYYIDIKRKKIDPSKVWSDKRIEFFNDTDQDYKEKSEKEKSKFRERKLKKIRREAAFLNQFYRTQVPVIIGKYAHIISEYLGEGDVYEYVEKVDKKQPEVKISIPFPKVASANFKEKVNLIKEICFAYNNLHHNTIQTGRALFHGDVKGTNIRIKYNEKKHAFDVYIVDFGIARHLGDDPETIFSAFKYLQDELNPQSEERLPKGSPYHLAPEAFEGYQGIFNDIYILTVILLIILDAEHPFMKKITASQGFNEYFGEKKAAREDFDFTGLKIPKFPLNINVAQYVTDFINRMQNQNYLLRPSTDEMLRFIVTFSNLCEVCDLYIQTNNIEEKQLFEQQIYIYAAKLALLASGLWDVKIAERQIPEFKLKKMGRRDSNQDLEKIELQKVRDAESVRGILATKTAKTFEQLDFDQHPTFCRELVRLHAAKQLSADAIQFDAVRLNFIKRNVTVEQPIMEYDNCFIILHLSPEAKPEYYLVDKTKKISPYSNQLFAAQLIDSQTGAIIKDRKEHPQRVVRVTKNSAPASAIAAGKQEMEIIPVKNLFDFSYIEFKPGIFEVQTVSFDAVTISKNEDSFYEMITYLDNNNRLTKELAIVFGIFFAECELTPDKIAELKEYANHAAKLSLLTRLQQNNCFTKEVAETILVHPNQAFIFFEAVNVLNNLKILTPKIVSNLVHNQQLTSAVSQLTQMSGEIVYLFSLEKDAKEKIALINSLTAQQKRQLLMEIRIHVELDDRFKATSNNSTDIINLLEFSINSTYISNNELTIRQAHIFSSLKQKYLSQERLVNYKYSIQTTKTINLLDFILLADDADLSSKFLDTLNTKQKLELLETIFKNNDLLSFYYAAGLQNLKTVLAHSIEFDLVNTVEKYRIKLKELRHNDIPGMRFRFFGQILHVPNYHEEYDAAKLLINTIRSFIAGDENAITEFYSNTGKSGETLKHRCHHALRHGELQNQAKEFMAFLSARRPLKNSAGPQEPIAAEPSTALSH